MRLLAGCRSQCLFASGHCDQDFVIFEFFFSLDLESLFAYWLYGNINDAISNLIYIFFIFRNLTFKIIPNFNIQKIKIKCSISNSIKLKVYNLKYKISEIEK